MGGLMRFLQAARMASDDQGPLWARRKKRRASAGPLVGLLVTLLALIGALTTVLSIKERSVAEAGAMMDGWIAAGWSGAQRLAGRAPEVADKATDKAGAAVEKTGDALQAGAAATRDELKTQ